MTMKVYLDPPSKKDREQIDEVHVRTADIMLMDYKHAQLPANHLYLFGPWRVNLRQMRPMFINSVFPWQGQQSCFVDGKLIVDNETKQVLGDSFFGAGTREEIGEMKLQKGRRTTLVLRLGPSRR